MAETDEIQTEVGPGRAVELVEAGAQLVDVRQDYEWDAGHIAGASHIPLEQLPSRAEELDHDRPIVFSCRSGSRSAMATSVFRESGFEAFNLTGGLLGWVEEGREVEPADGEVAGPRLDAT